MFTLDILEAQHLNVFLGNTLWDIFAALAILVGIIFVLKIFQVLILSRLKALANKTKNDYDDILVEMLSGIKFLFYVIVALYFSLQYLNLPDWVSQVIKFVLIVSIIFEVVQAVDRVIGFVLKKYTGRQASQQEKEQVESMSRIVSMVVKAVLWIIGVLMILSNFGINVTSLVASLGIGGIAIALALQNILSDLFSSFSIYLDKPFQIGDFIIIGENMGTVEKVGIKSTRIRSLGGEQLIVSNKELTSTRVQNYGRMQRRRVVFRLGLTYEMTGDKLIRANEIIKNIIDKTDKVTFDRTHFFEFGDSSLNIEVVMFIESSDYNEYMDLRQKINLQIMQEFANENLEFAYPTQTVYVEKK